MGARAIFQLETPWTEDEVFDLGYEQAADAMVFTHLDHQPQRLSRFAHDNWTLADAVFLATVVPPAVPTITPVTPNTTGYQATVYTYVVTSIDAATGHESLPTAELPTTNDLTLKGNENVLDFLPLAGMERYNVYRKGGGSFGYIGAVEQDPTLAPIQFRDDNVAPDFSQSYPRPRDPFAAVGDKPAVVCFWQQRAVYGRTLNKPNGVFASQSGNLFNFNVAQPLLPTDAATFAVSGRRVNAVLHLVPLKDLIVFTTDTVFSVKGNVGEGFSPVNIDIQPESYRASSRVRPVVIDDIIFFGSSKGSAIRTLGYQFEADGYKGNDLTVFAPHLFRRLTVTDMTWAEYPTATVYVVGADGKARTLTWQAEQQVWGWSLMSTRGLIESVCSVNENNQDVTYFVVQRQVEGVVQRFIEYTADILWEDVADCVYLDSSRTYSGEPVDNVRGMEHLEGETVTVLADGAVYEDHTRIVDGSFETPLPVAASTITVGYGFEAWIRTLPLASDPNSTLKGTPQTVAGATISVLRTRGIEAAQGKDSAADVSLSVEAQDEALTFDEIKTREGEPMGEPTDLFSGELWVDLEAGDWRTASVVVRQRYPLPMHVTGITPEYVLGD